MRLLFIGGMSRDGAVVWKFHEQKLVNVIFVHTKFQRVFWTIDLAELCLAHYFQMSIQCTHSIEHINVPLHSLPTWTPRQFGHALIFGLSRTKPAARRQCLRTKYSDIPKPCKNKLNIEVCFFFFIHYYT